MSSFESPFTQSTKMVFAFSPSPTTVRNLMDLKARLLSEDHVEIAHFVECEPEEAHAVTWWLADGIARTKMGPVVASDTESIKAVLNSDMFSGLKAEMVYMRCVDYIDPFYLNCEVDD